MIRHERAKCNRGGVGSGNSQFVHRDLVQGIEIAIAIGIGVDFIIDPGDFDPDPDEPSHIENCYRPTRAAGIEDW